MFFYLLLENEGENTTHKARNPYWRAQRLNTSKQQTTSTFWVCKSTNDSYINPCMTFSSTFFSVKRGNNCFGIAHEKLQRKNVSPVIAMHIILFLCDWYQVNALELTLLRIVSFLFSLSLSPTLSLSLVESLSCRHHQSNRNHRNVSLLNVRLQLS